MPDDGVFEQIDPQRLARHEQLLNLWHALPAEELLLDLSVLAQLAAFRQQQERIARATTCTQRDCAWRQP